LNIAAVLRNPHPSWWVYVLAVLIYPAIAFTANLLDPIPCRRLSDHEQI